MLENEFHPQRLAHVTPLIFIFLVNVDVESHLQSRPLSPRSFFPPPPFFSSSIHSLRSVSTSLSRFHIWSPRFSSRGGAAPAQKQSSFVRRAHTYCVVTADQCKHEPEVQHTEESRRRVWRMKRQTGGFTLQDWGLKDGSETCCYLKLLNHFVRVSSLIEAVHNKLAWPAKIQLSDCHIRVMLRKCNNKTRQPFFHTGSNQPVDWLINQSINQSVKI